MTAPRFIQRCRRNRPENVIARVAFWLIVLGVAIVILVQWGMR